MTPIQPPALLTPSRRQWLCGAAALAGSGLAAPVQAKTEAYPKGPVKLVVPFTPGGATDVIARKLGDQLSKSLNAPFVIENKPGAFGMIGTDQVVKAAPDGQTIGLILSGVVLINPHIYTKVPYQVERDIALISKVADTAGVLAVHPSVPVKNAQDFVAYLKANPDKLNFGSYGQGSSPHLLCEYLRKTLDARMNHVPYKGEAPLVQDMLGNQVQVGIASLNAQKQHFDAGKLRPIALIAGQRTAAMPELATMAEQGFGDDVFRMQNWFGIIAPKATPAAIQDQLAQAIGAVMATPEMQEMIVKMGYTPVADSTPRKLVAEYREWAPRWKKLAELSGAKIDQ
ncbi:hypothetical protein CCO03_07600 [Comamonas serinivorans]|uniref:ABC transporter substrate-binding protein n=1 Tax=Comamonas serinivorans TaxID=1082851 RepID=A0A1Y0EMK1_9BURK|nr:tripartite tricarboxylate transporter substrate binding protein [Comamonas serinivorans]ARU04559.1 hypothetical protein CCO03_07600 [Comamonas serinivorans]